MGLISVALQELMAAGLKGDELVAAIERIEAASAPYRSKGAERTARWRERRRASQSVTCDGVTVRDAPPASPASPSDGSPTPPPITTSSPPPSPPSRRSGRAHRGRPLPEDWAPSQADLDFAEQPVPAFESGIIHLNQRDLSKWQQAFSQLDLKAELIGLTQWAEQQGPRWFHAVSGALAKKNRDARERSEHAKRNGLDPNDWRSAIA